MKKTITISHDDGPMEAMDMVEGVLQNLGVEYTTIEGEEDVKIEYITPVVYTHSSRLEKRLYEKWEATGFLDGMNPSDSRLMSEIFEDLAVHLLINPQWDGEPWETVIFPVIRKVFSAIGNTDRINLDISEFVKRFIDFYDSHQDAVGKIDSDLFDVEAELALLISKQLIDYITNENSSMA